MRIRLRNLLTRLNILILMGIVVAYGLAGFLLAPLVVRWYMPVYVEQELHCRAELQQVYINPFLLTIEFKGFSLKQNDGQPLAAFQRIFVDLESSSLVHRAVVLRELELDKPDVHVAFEADGTINLERLTASQAPAKPTESDGKLLPFIVRNLVIDGGRISVVDNHLKTPAKLNLKSLRLHFTDLSSVKDHNGTYALSAVTEQGESLRWEGKVFPEPFRSQGKITLKAVKTASLWKFFRNDTNLEQPTGLIDIHTAYNLDAGNNTFRMTLDRLRLMVSDLSLKLVHEKKPFVELRQLQTDIPRFDLTGKQLHIGRLSAEDGSLDVQINDSGESNLQRILRASSADKHHNAGKTSSAAAKPVTSTIRAKGNVAVASPSATAAKTDPPFKIVADAVHIKNVSVAVNDKSRMLPVLAKAAAVDLSFKAKVETGPKGTRATLSDISNEMKTIRISSTASTEPLLAVKRLSVSGGDCNLGAHTLSVSRIALDTGSFAVVRDSTGKIDWQRLFQAKGTADKTLAEHTTASPAAPWKIMIKSIEAEGFNSKFWDLTTHSDKPVVGLQGINAKISDFNGKSPMGFQLDFQEAQGGSVKLSGTINPSVPSVESGILVNGVSLTSLQPYIEPYVSLVLKSAVVSAEGKLLYGIPGAGQKFAYNGDLNVAALNITNPGSQKTFLSWDALRIPKITFNLQPNGLDIPEVTIVKPAGDLIIGSDRTLNAVKVVKDRGIDDSTPASAPAATKENREEFPYRIARVQVDGGKMLFADMSIHPGFSSRIHDIKGNISGLSSSKESRAKIRLNGQVNDYGIARIRGTLRLGDFRRSSDIHMVFRNLDMKNLSPYSGKFAGRLIDSGKISADLKYKLQNYKMTGDNEIVLENLVLGKHVDEPGASNLPLDLAVALLQDADGRINIGLPIAGDLSDPQFSIGPLVLKLFTNLITKAVTSPFLALGNMFGGDFEHFDLVEFAPGSDELSPPEKEKLVKLTEALNKRPQLTLVILGRYNPDIDGGRIKSLIIRRLVAAKLGEKPGPEERPRWIDYTDPKTQNILEELYGEYVEKPTLVELDKGLKTGEIKSSISERLHKAIINRIQEEAKTGGALKLYKIIPGAKSPEQAALWAGELYSRLLVNQKVPGRDFLRLATERARAVAEELENVNDIPKDRIRIIDTEAPATDGNPSVKLSLEAR